MIHESWNKFFLSISHNYKTNPKTIFVSLCNYSYQLFLTLSQFLRFIIHKSENKINKVLQIFLALFYYILKQLDHESWKEFFLSTSQNYKLNPWICNYSYQLLLTLLQFLHNIWFSLQLFLVLFFATIPDTIGWSHVISSNTLEKEKLALIHDHFLTISCSINFIIYLQCFLKS